MTGIRRASWKRSGSNAAAFTFGVVPLLLGGVALLASWLPARRALRVPPNEALRADG